MVNAAAHDKAAAIAAAIASLGVDACSSVYVGDHPEDCRSAQQAHVRFVGVTTGAHRASDFPDGTVILASVADLPTQLLAAR